MRRLFLAGAAIVATALAAPAPARAQISLGARVGAGLSLGKVGGTLAMSDWLKEQIPIQVDALYRWNERLAFGAYFSHGFARTSGDLRDLCDLPGADCTGRVERLGAQVQYTFATKRRHLPWAGAGIGYEWNRLDSSDPTGRVKVTYKGWEYLNLQAGVDFRLGRRFLAGPFVLFSVTQYEEGELSGDFGTGSGAIDSKKLHEWLTAGVRGRFEL